MLTASCPKCAKQVTVPNAARPESRVRCPLCAEEYSLESVFADLPPLLVLLDAPALNGTSGIHADEPIMAASASGVGGSSSIFDFGAKEQADAGESPDADADTAIALADAEDVIPKSNAFDFNADPAAESIGGAPRTTTARPKPKKKGASPIKSLIGVVVGGLVALPMAQLILWYLPGGWDVGQRDPMEIGRKYGLLAPSWVTSEAEVTEPAPDTSNPDSPPLDKPPVDAVNNIDPNGSSLGRDDLNGALTGNNKPPEPTDNETPIIDDGNDNGGETIPPVEEPVIEPAGPKSPVKNAPTFTSSDLAKDLKVARDEQNLINTATKADGDGRAKKAAAEKFLANLSQVAKVLTFADKRPEGHMEHVHELVATASDSLQKRKVVSTLASLAFGKAANELPGTVFMGTVKEIQQRGEIFETVVEMDTAAKKPMSIYTADDPQGTIAVGDTVAVLGVIVDEPNNNISGYKGEPDPVVWGGYWQVVPVEESP